MKVVVALVANKQTFHAQSWYLLGKAFSSVKSMVQLFLKVTCMRVIQKFKLVDMFGGPLVWHSILSLYNLVAVSKTPIITQNFGSLY